MGFLTFEDRDEKRILSNIKRRLKRRRLKPDLDSEWEVHGPHNGMNYQVFIGCCSFIPKEGDKCICPEGSQLTYCPIHGFQWVAIYPWAIYGIDDSRDWWKVTAEDRIPVIKQKRPVPSR